MSTSVKHIATLCIILVFSNCTKSLRCYECADKGDSALDCFPAYWKEQMHSILPPSLSSCEKQRSVLCNGHCNNFTLSGCGNNDLRRYSEVKIRIFYDIIPGVRLCEPMVELSFSSSCQLKSWDEVGISN